jgi:putative tricarboxylic transport membrane protein
MKKDLIGGLVLLVIAGLYHLAIGSIAESTLSDEVGATGLPRILALILALLAVALIGRALLARRRAVAADNSDDTERQPAAPVRAVGLLLFGAGYIVLLPIVGYVIGVALLIAGVALYEGARRTWKVPAIAAGGALLYWMIFVKLLGVPQPTGLLLDRVLG